MTTYTLKVIEIRKETDDVITICFKQPALRKVKYDAGQYLTLIFRINGRRYIRPYSFSSAPSTDSSLEVTVKRVSNGIVSNHIHDIIKVGDSIEAMPPMGDFIYKKDNLNRPVFLWGVGSGITPLISIVKQIIYEYPEVRVNLIYGSRNNESIIFADQINELIRCNSIRLSVKHFHTQISVLESSPTVVQGRITRKSVFEIMEHESKESLHFICGPVGLKESVKEGLAELDISSSNVFSEDFEIVKDPKLFEEISTQIISLIFNGNKHNLEVVKGKSILDSALDANIELPYSCQTGSCSTCKAKLITGETKMIGLTKERTDLAEDEYLLCCTHPLTDNVNIEI